MKKRLETTSHKNDSPIDFADALGIEYASSVLKALKKKTGQFFTPSAIAGFMGELANPSKVSVRILDPGSGTGVLSCALVERLAGKSPRLKKVEITAYETDENILPYAKKGFDYLKRWLRKRNVELRYKIIQRDFILDNEAVFDSGTVLNLFDQPTIEKYDYIISNPPYFKLSKEDPRTQISGTVVSGQPNIYALFMAVASKLLNDDGQMIVIVPRSFASGDYFRAFRDFFFSHIEVTRIHLFHSRKDAFHRDDVLQELLILKGIPRKSGRADPKIAISTSHGAKDISSVKMKVYHEHELVNLRSREKILHLPTNGSDVAVINRFRGWTHKLRDFGIEISTGPVVAFRVMKYIKEDHDEGNASLAPLYWLHNVVRMNMEWPVHKVGKNQYIEICEGSRSVLVPNRNYVLLRRFSAKDDKSRLIAAPHFVNPNEPDYIGIENKLNYIYRPKGELERSEVMGLAVLLNSKLFDTYFRTFNGNVNVSATELREMPFPPLETIKEIGNNVIALNDYSTSNIDHNVEQFLKGRQAVYV